MSALKNCTDVRFVSFLEGCLRWEAADRFAPEDALKHEWITEAPPSLTSPRAALHAAQVERPRSGRTHPSIHQSSTPHAHPQTHPHLHPSRSCHGADGGSSRCGSAIVSSRTAHGSGQAGRHGPGSCTHGTCGQGGEVSAVSASSPRELAALSMPGTAVPLPHRRQLGADRDYGVGLGSAH
uniref:Protein kinase domain-containing protein n=1 Tax=Haptolina brevifila TaxID=156173 RepID=A0A7S2J6W0_9EUKA